MHHWNSTVSPWPTAYPSLWPPPPYLTPLSNHLLSIGCPRQRWVRSLPCAVTSSSCRLRNGWRVSVGYPLSESPTGASWKGQRQRKYIYIATFRHKAFRVLYRGINIHKKYEYIKTTHHHFQLVILWTIGQDPLASLLNPLGTSLALFFDM